MNYVFDPDNWEWLVTGNNARFILEGFLVNLEIAVIAMVLSLIVGLALALARLSRSEPVSVAAGVVGRRLAQPAADLHHPLPRARRSRARGRTRTRTRSRRGSRRACSPAACWRPSSGSCSTTRPSWPRSCARASSRSTAARARRPARSGMSYRQSMRLRGAAAGPAADGAGHRVPADHAQQGHDAGLASSPSRRSCATAGSSPASTSSAASRRPMLQVFLFIGLLFIIVNLTLSRLSRRLEVRERKRDGRGQARARARRAGAPRRLRSARAARRARTCSSRSRTSGSGASCERPLARRQAVGDAVGARQRVRVARPRVGRLGRQRRRLLAGGHLGADVAHQVRDQREVEQALLARRRARARARAPRARPRDRRCACRSRPEPLPGGGVAGRAVDLLRWRRRPPA